MATGLSTEILRVDLPLAMYVKDWEILCKGKEDIARDLKRYIDVLQERIKQTNDFPFINIVDVGFNNGWVYISFGYRNEQELESIYECLKNEKNNFSDFLSKYFMDKSMEMIAGLPLFTEIKCSISMPTYLYLQCKQIDKRNNGELESKESSPNVNYAGNVKEKVEQMEKSLHPYSSNLQTKDSLPEASASIQRPPGGYPYEPKDHPLPPDRNTCMTKTFLLYYPIIKGWKIKKIQIQSVSRYLNADMTRHGVDMYEFSVALPIDLVQSSYQYICHLKSDSVLNFKDNLMGTPAVKSIKYKVDKHTVQRDNWMELGKRIYDANKYDEECLAAHLTDILFHCEQKVDLKDLCFQIEQICFPKLPIVNAMHLLKEIQAFLPSGTSKTRLLFIVVIGNVLTNYQQIKQRDILDETTVRSLLRDLKQFRLKDLPVSCEKYIYSICLSLCVNVHGLEMCLIEYLNTCFPFYDDIFVLQRLQSYVSSGTTIAHDKKPMYECALQLCQKLYKVSKKSTKAREALDLVLRHLPFNMTLYVTSSMRLAEMAIPEDELDLQNVLSIAVQVRTDKSLNAIKKSKDIQELYNLCKNITNCIKVTDQLQSKFEGTLLIILESFPSSATCPVETVVKFHKEFGFFTEENSMRKFLHDIMESQNKSVHELVFKLSHYSDIAKVFLLFTRDELQSFSLKYVTNYFTKRDQAFNHFLKCFIKLCELKHVEHNKLNDILDFIFLRELDKMQPKELLQNIEVIAKVADSHRNVENLFVDYIKRILNETTERPDDLIECVTTQKGQPDVNNRLSASLVCTLLETFGCEADMSDFERFFQFVSHCQFWMLIFQCTGKYIDIVHMNAKYIEAKSCISRIGKLFITHEVHYDFVQRLECNKQYASSAKKLLELEINKDDIERFWSDALNKFKEVKDQLCITHDVLAHVKRKSPNLPIGFDSLLKRICDNENKFTTGMITANECSSDTLIWQDIEILPEICENIRNVVPSSVFWNVSSDLVYQTYLNETEMLNEDDPLHSLCELFQEPSVYDRAYDNTEKACLLFMTILQNVGLTKYGDTWKSLLKDDSLQMEDVLKMFGSTPDVSKEIRIAKTYLHIVIEEDIEESLNNIFSSDAIERTVDAIESVVAVFGLNWKEDQIFSKSIVSFRKLLQGSAKEYTFKDVKTALKTVFAMVKNISGDTLNIMIVLGNSTTLITFIKSILDEDIKNLIDAVEDISEQQVRESTVSALIDVKQFLYPLLLSKDVKSIEEFFQILEKQTQLLRTGSASLPPKIEDCRQNLHNLKSLYNGVANRGEQTKEMIKNIIQKGKILFQLNKMKTSTTFEASYKQNKIKEIRKRSTLIDLRSRALLLMNTERQSANDNRYNRDELMKFIDFIDICLNIAETLFLLHTSGHKDFINVKEVIKPHELLKKKEELVKYLDLWLQDIHEERDEHYLMNFIKGNQIHILYMYLEENSRKTDIVQTILTFIHPMMQAERLKKIYDEEKSMKTVWSNRVMLYCIGFSLHELFEGLHIFKRNIHKSKGTNCLNDFVMPGRLLVAQLEEWSMLTIRTVLALYINTTQRLPEPNHILFCTRETDWSELDLLIRRCLGSMEFYKEKVLFCIVNVEILSNELQFKLVAKLRHLPKSSKFCLAVICRGSRNHPFIDELSDCTSSVTPVSDKTVRDIFEEHCENVVTVTSMFPGLGKTSFIAAEAHMQKKGMVTLHVSGSVRKMSLLYRINGLHVKQYHILHIDLGNVESPSELDTFLFELVVLRYVSAGTLSVGLQTASVYIEIANTINDTLKNALQTTILFARKEIKWNGMNDLTISRELNSPVQVVCQYLHHLDNGTIDKKDICFGEKSEKPLSSKHCRSLLQKYIGGKLDTSFPAVFTFINVLADQLKKMSHSSFFKTNRLIDMIGNKVNISVKSQLLKAMIDVSCDFASRSVDVCRESQISTIHKDNQQSDLASSVTHRVDSMIRWEDSNHLMFLFHNQNIHTISALYRNLSLVPREIKNLFESQMKKAMEDFRSMDQKKLQSMLQKVARISPLPLPEKELLELSKDYALTADNLLKMVLIMLRVKANIPVIVMGETGCGKTSLIRYLAAICEVNFDVMNIHAGVKEEDIVDKVLRNNLKAMEQIDSERWLFLDEINTSDSIGVISDIICHHKCLGKDLSPNLTIMCACNPYKLRTTKDISTAGLEGKIKSDELSRLVYRVLPLPEMMVDYVWDFGTLNEKDEETYIYRMIYDIFKGDENHQMLLTSLLSTSQSFVRRHEESCYSVSLRDIHRCKILTKWFIKILPTKEISLKEKQKSDKLYIKAMILSLAHCYQSRFAEKRLRKEYRCKIGEVFKLHGYQFPGEQDHFIQTVIKEEQSDILRRMKLPPGTARNTALQENVFVILVCIFNRIPIFVVGKPGCSKSLAMQLIKSNLRGKDSEDDFFKELPQLYCVSFQGSESSTSDGIIKVFEKAKKYQDSNNIEDVLSVVILDEIGLAEVSRFNPLKVLHNLLEPDGASQPDVAVVGISNWALDASKMNRAIHLSRTDMDEEELFDTALSISESFLGSDCRQSLFKTKTEYNKESALQYIQEELSGMAKAYFQYINELRFKNFHGLRDYYSLIKFVARMFAEKNCNCSEEDKAEIISDGIARNFGGLPDEVQTLHDVFQRHLHILIYSEKPPIDMITENITDPLARHLMLITTGESALGIVEHNLKEIGCERKEVIFGSQFEEDLTDDYNYRILSRIILCMEEGVVLILKDLENIYGSLYDMLNQNYTIIGKKKNCRIALGPYSNPICHVADSFRCIVLVDEKKVDLTDPPFLNRFEKQYLRFFDIIQKKHIAIIERLNGWINDLSDTEEGVIEKEQMFPILSNDLTASLVLKIDSESSYHHVLDYSEAVFATSKERLLRIMKPEIVTRQRSSKSETVQICFKEMIRQYFSLPIHNGIENFILEQIETSAAEELAHGLLNIIFTNSNVHTKVQFTNHSLKVQVEKLGTFKSEKQLSTRIQSFWDSVECNIMIVHCNAKDDEKHILLTKLVIERCRIEYIEKSCTFPKHVYFIIHLDRSNTSPHCLSQLNFLSEWKLFMMDSLEKPTISLQALLKMTLQEAIVEQSPLRLHIQEELFWAFSRINYGNYGRDISSISNAISKIENSFELNDIFEKKILAYTEKQFSGKQNKYWHTEVACNKTALTSSSSFIDALERYIMSKIKIPLAKLIYEIERTGILESFFQNNNGNDVDLLLNERKRLSWISGTNNKRIFSIDNIPDETGPECYTCNSADFALRVPFGKNIYDRIESTKDEFMEMVQLYRVQCLINEDEELPAEVYEAVCQQHEQTILKIVPDLTQFTYESWEIEYFLDFCVISSHNILNNINEQAAQCLALILERLGVKLLKDPYEYILRVHTTLWINFTSVRSEMVLIQKCISVIPDSKNDIIEILHQFAKRPTLSSEIEPNVALTKDNLKNERAEVQRANEFEQPGLHESFLNEDFESGVIPSNENYLLKTETEELSGACGQRLCKSIDVVNMEPLQMLKGSFEYDSVKNENKECSMNTNVSLSDSNRELDLQENDKELREGMFSSSTDDDRHSMNDDSIVISDTNQEINARANERHDEIKNEYEDSDKYSNTLVNIVCKTLLPTAECLKHHNSLRHWLEEVTSTVSLAAMVSRSPEVLYSVRACIEIASQVIIPVNLNTDILEEIGTSISNGDTLDSKDIFSLIKQLIDSALSKANVSTEHEHMEVNTICQRVLSSYFIRCLSADPETKAYGFMFALIIERKIPDVFAVYYKVPLKTFIQSVDVEHLITMLSDENCGSFKTENGDMENIYDIFAFEFLECLDSCVKVLLLDERFEDPFLVLIVDILQDIFKNECLSQSSELSKTEEVTNTDHMSGYDLNQRSIELFYTCHITLKKHEPGLKYVASVAFCKTFVSNSFIMHQKASSEEQKSILNNLDIVLNDLPGQETHPLALYFLKQMLKTRSLTKVENTCIYEKDTRFMQIFNWTKERTFNDFAKSPMCLYMTEMEHKDSCLNCKTLPVSDFIEKIDNIVLKSCASKCGMLQLFSLTFQEFYLQLTDKDLDDTQHSLAKIILNKVMGTEIGSETKIFIKCILGEQNFNVKDFFLTEASSNTHACKASFLISIYSILLVHYESNSHISVPDNENMPLFIRCLLHPNSMVSCLLPGFPVILTDCSTQITKSLNQENVFYTGLCQCGYRIASPTQRGPNVTCSVCKQGLICLETMGKSKATARLAQFKALNINDVHVSEWINPVTSNVLQLLLKGCLLGSLALGFISEKDLEDTLNLSDCDVGDILGKGVDHHWTVTKHLLNIDDNTFLALLHVIVMKTSNHLFYTDCNFRNADATLEWEEQFDSMLTSILETRFDKVRTLYQHHNRTHNGDKRSLSMCLLESDDVASMPPENMLVCLPNLYRIRSSPNKDNFVYELYNVRDKFPLLSTVVAQEQELQLPEHILSFIQWHAATVANASYMLKSHECDTMTVQDFIYFKQNTMKKDVMKQRFEAFRKSWEYLMLKLQKDPISGQMKRIHSESKIKECLILNKHSLPLKILQKLISIQNNFLDTALLLSFNCNSLKMLQRENVYALPCVKVTEVKREQLINSELDWENLLQQESHCNLKYSCGKQIAYDFYSIEEAVSLEMVSGKYYIILDSNLPEIVFIDELHKNYGNLIRELRKSVPQRPLPSDISNGIKSRKAEDPRMSTELLTHLGIVMTLMKKTSGDTDLPLVDYVDKWKSILCRNFPKKLLPSPETSLKLGHVVALSELLEELCAESVKEGLDDVYRDILDGPLHDHIVLQLKDDLLSSVLYKALKRFTYRCLASRTADPKQSLRLYLSDESFWPMSMFQDNALLIGEKLVNITDILPDGLMVRHIFEFFELMDKEMERKEKGRIKMSGFATSFQAKAKVTLPSKKEQKKKRTTNIRKF